MANETKLIDRKNYYCNGELNAAAFIEFFPCGKVQVYGKFYDGFRGHRGPETGMIAEVPYELLQEVRSTTWQQNNKSSELKNWCEKIWQQAKEMDNWFERF